MGFVQRNKFQILKFVFVGLISTCINFIFYSFIYNLTSSINLASFIGYCLGLLNSFYFSDKWVFQNSRKKRLKNAFILFLFIYILGGLEMTLTINIINYLFKDHNVAWLCGAFMAASSNYLFSKYFLFND